MSKEMRNLLVFYAATFAWTWACYLPIALTGGNPYQMPWTILLIAGGAGPSIMGVLMAIFTFDKADLRAFWSRCFSPSRIPGRIWLFIFLIYPILTLISTVTAMLLGDPLPEMRMLRGLMAAPWQWPLAIFIAIMSGPFAEEFGWRGYALEPGFKRWGVWSGSILLGFLWGIWHLPLFFMPDMWHGQIGLGFSGLGMFILLSIGNSLLITYAYQRTSRSILTGLLMHFAANFTGNLFGPFTHQGDALRMGAIFLAGVLVMWLAARKAPVARAQAVGQG